jgi:hypothetical protein
MRAWQVILLVALCSASLTWGDTWQVGGHGRAAADWDDSMEHQILLDYTSVTGAIQPRRFVSGRDIGPEMGNQWFDRRFPYTYSQWAYREGFPRLWLDVNFTTTMMFPILSWVDGDPVTYTSYIDFSPQIYTMDLGAAVPVEGMALVVPEGIYSATDEPYRPNFVPRNFEIWGASDETTIDLEMLPGFSWSRLDPPKLDALLYQGLSNRDPDLQISIPPQYLRFIRLNTIKDGLDTRNRDVVRRFALSEWQVFASGYPQDAVWMSDVQDMGRDVVFGRVYLAASKWRYDPETGTVEEAPDAAVGAQVQLQTGRDDTPVVHYSYDDLGGLVEVADSQWYIMQYKGRAGGVPGVRGPKVDDVDEWSPWSPPMDAASAHTDLPWGRYLRASVKLHSDLFYEFARVDSVWVETAPLLADQVLAEVAAADDLQPAQRIPLLVVGEETRLVCRLAAAFGAQARSGFDALRIRTPAPALLTQLEMGISEENLAVVPEDSVLYEDRGFVIYLPTPVRATGPRHLRVTLQTSLFGVAAEISGEVFNRDRGNLRQPIEGGDASDAVGTDQLAIVASSTSASGVLTETGVLPQAFSPQGDGVNDRTQIRYTLLRVESADVKVEILDLSGRCIWSEMSIALRSGRHATTWNGRDSAGHVVAPGTYIARITADTDHGDQARLCALAVAY